MEKKLRSATYDIVRKICDEVGTELNVTYDADSKDLISELVWKKLQLYGLDLEAFSKHGKRSTITTDDVKLLVRRNTSLKEFVEENCKNTASIKTEAASKKRKRIPSEAPGPSTSSVVVIE